MAEIVLLAAGPLPWLSSATTTMGLGRRSGARVVVPGG
jgi:hypothetical protein